MESRLNNRRCIGSSKDVITPRLSPAGSRPSIVRSDAFWPHPNVACEDPSRFSNTDATQPGTTR